MINILPRTLFGITLRPLAVKEAVDSIIQSMYDRPNDFDITEHNMLDIKTKYTYWISSYPRIYTPYKMKFGWYHGKRFERALDDLKTYQLKKKLNEAKK